MPTKKRRGIRRREEAEDNKFKAIVIQLGAWCSNQSTVISSREILSSKLNEIKRKYANREVPLPSMWGGYRVTPQRIEFWQQGTDRLHDRFLYEKSNSGTWSIHRLAP